MEGAHIAREEAARRKLVRKRRKLWPLVACRLEFDAAGEVVRVYGET